MKTIHSFGRSRLPARRVLALAVLAVAGVLSIAGTAGAGSPTFTDPGTLSVLPSPGAGAVAYSKGTQPTFVQYTITYARDPSDTSTLTHAAVSDPVTCDAAGNCSDASLQGGTIVSVTGCTGDAGGTLSYRNSQHGFTCSYGSLRTGATITLTVLVKIDACPDCADSTMTNLAALTVNEGGNDSQPNANNTDTFPTNADPVTKMGVPVSTTLTDTTTNGFNTFTNPNSTDVQTYSTDTALGGTNGQSTEAKLKAGVGVTVGLGEADFGAGQPCPGTQNGLECFGQSSTIDIGESGASGIFACDATDPSDTNCLRFQVVVLGSTIGNVKTRDIVIYHQPVPDGPFYPVPRCSTGLTDTMDASGDCIVSITQNPRTKDLTWIARGPSNGTWGGAR